MYWFAEPGDPLAAALPLNERPTESLYLQLANDISRKVAQGILPPGTRLLSERRLAESLHLSRCTVVSAYQELEARGVIRRRIGRGTFVCALPASNAAFSWAGRLSVRRSSTHEDAAANISFAGAQPALAFLQTDRFRFVADAVLRGSLAQLTTVPHSNGFAPLRATMAERYDCKPENVLITPDGLPALRLVFEALTQHDDVVIVNSPCSPGALAVIEDLGLRAAEWPIGASVSELEGLMVSRKPKLLYVMPTFQNPTGRTMSREKRLELLAVAARYRLPVVEHDTSSALWFDSPPPPDLRTLDGEGVVIHIGGTSKTLGNGCRLAFVVAPPGAIERLGAAQDHSGYQADLVTQMIVHGVMRRGIFEAHVSELRRMHGERYKLAVDAFRKYLAPLQLRLHLAHGGLTLWCSLPRPVSTADLVVAAHQRGVSFSPGELFHPQAQDTREVRVCFATVPPPLIDEGIRLMAEAIAETLRDVRLARDANEGVPCLESAVPQRRLASGEIQVGSFL